MSDYLWDKTGEPEEDVEQLENLLGALKYQTRPLDIPLSAMPTAKARPATIFFSRPRLAIAASLLLTLLAGIWFVTRQTEQQQQSNGVAAVDKGSEQRGVTQPEKVVATNDETGKKASDKNASGDNTVKPKLREERARIVTASAPKVHRAPRGLVARRQKLRPRVEDAPAPRELVATIGGMRWQTEQPLTPQQREATEKLMLALQVASAKFNYAQREMQESGRTGK